MQPLSPRADPDLLCHPLRSPVQTSAMQTPGFTTAVPLRTVVLRTSTVHHRAPICARAKKGKRAKKERKAQPSPRQTPNPKPVTQSSEQSQSSETPRSGTPKSAETRKYPGPIAPELLPDAPGPDVSFPSDDLPIADESRLRLPDLNAPSIRRKRKPREAPQVKEVTDDDDTLPTDAIRRLTKAYRQGGDEAKELISEIEKNPDYMIQTGNPSGEYDLTSAIIGSGRPNKQGLYVLPYLQSGHFLLLAIILVVAFVYYPGFPLTEADDGVRQALKGGLAAVGVLNAVLASFAFRSAKKRGQPALFWALKTAFLGDLAYGELRRNAPLVKDDEGGENS